MRYRQDQPDDVWRQIDTSKHSKTNLILNRQIHVVVNSIIQLNLNIHPNFHNVFNLKHRSVQILIHIFSNSEHWVSTII